MKTYNKHEITKLMLNHILVDIPKCCRNYELSWKGLSLVNYKKFMQHFLKKHYIKHENTKLQFKTFL